MVGNSERWTIEHVAVLDDGSGMESDALRAALQFGNGSHLEDRSGIGRFGMGLPSASISQCRRVNVWSWTNGHKNALYSYIDLDEVAAGKQSEVPEPKADSVPEYWLDAAGTLGTSGTLVVWSELDKFVWKKAQTLIRNSESLIGRMYREYLVNGRASIRMVAFQDPKSPRIDRLAVANDPGYLMVPTSTPVPFDNKPMFEQDGDIWQEHFNVDYKGAKHQVTVSYSIARNEARIRDDGNDAGNLAYGRHAKSNVGVSLMRAERELELDQTLVDKSDTRQRWWGVEIDFPPSLDEVFGVTNNKQTARNFTTLAKNFEDLTREDGRSETELKKQLEEEQDPQAVLIEIIGAVKRRIVNLNARIKNQRANARGGPRKTRYDSESAEIQATTATKERQDAGKIGSSDEDEKLDAKERIRQITDELVEEEGLTETEAREIAADAIESNSKYLFRTHTGDGNTFFTVKSKAGEIFIRLNENHAAYDHLFEVLEDLPENGKDSADVLERLHRARRGLKLLLLAWARLEDETTDAEARRALQVARADWGTRALQFLANN